MEPARKDCLSLSEYNQLEEQEQQRYEYHRGEVFAMAGAATDVGSPKHGAIAGNVIGLLRSALLNKDCTVFTSDVKFYIETEDRSCYPDVSVVCGPPQRSEYDTRALTNPVLLVEVLSKTTEGLDQGAKCWRHSTLPSFLEVERTLKSLYAHWALHCQWRSCIGKPKGCNTVFFKPTKSPPTLIIL